MLMPMPLLEECPCTFLLEHLKDLVSSMMLIRMNALRLVCQSRMLSFYKAIQISHDRLVIATIGLWSHKLELKKLSFQKFEYPRSASSDDASEIKQYVIQLRPHSRIFGLTAGMFVQGYYSTYI